MASNLRVDTILPSTGSNVAIGTASGSVTFVGDTDISTNGDVTIGGNLGIGGTLTYEDVTNIDSVGVITARSDLSIADKIIHTGDTNTAIRFPGADQFSIETAGSTRMSIDSSGKVSVGGETAIYNLNVRGSGQQTLLVGSTDAGGAYVTLDGDSNGDGQGGDYCHIGQTTSGDMELSADNPNGDANIIIKAGNAAEKLRVNSSGTLLVGATSYGGGGTAPALYVSNSGGRQVKIHNTNANTTSIQLTNATSGEGEDGGMMFATLGGSADGWINNAENAAIRFGTNGNERMRILAGGGLTFNGDTAAANALDDYEEGSFSVTLVGQYGGNAQYSYRAGYYTRIGRMVHVVGDVRFNGSWSGSSGNVYVQLPFGTSYASGGTVGNGTVAEWNLNNSNWDWVGITLDNNVANARFVTHSGSNNNTSHLQTGELGNGRYLKFGFTYITS